MAVAIAVAVAVAGPCGHGGRWNRRKKHRCNDEGRHGEGRNGHFHGCYCD